MMLFEIKVHRITKKVLKHLETATVKLYLKLKYTESSVSFQHSALLLQII